MPTNTSLLTWRYQQGGAHADPHLFTMTLSPEVNTKMMYLLQFDHWRTLKQLNSSVDYCQVPDEYCSMFSHSPTGIGACTAIVVEFAATFQRMWGDGKSLIAVITKFHEIC